MEKVITARHFHLRDDAKEAIHDRLAEINSEYRSLISTRVILDKEKNQFSCEIIMHGKHIDIEAKGKGRDPVVAFDASCDKAEKQLRRHFDKVKSHKHVSISQLEVEIEELDSADAEEEEEVFDVV